MKLPRTGVADALTRLFLILAGVVAAALFVIQGHAEALPALALGGTLGACMVSGLGGDQHEPS